MSRIARLLIPTLLPALALAQPAVPLDAVTATATRTPQAAGDVAAPVSVITREDLQRRQPRNLLDILRDIPGVEPDGLPRNSVIQPAIRGLGQDRVVVRLDGVRQNFSSGHRGRVFLDPELLSQVDVVRGPGSMLYGSGALGGVLALRLIDADDIIQPGNAVGARARVGYASNQVGWFTSTTAAGRSGPVDILGSFSTSTEGNAEDGRSRRIPFSAGRTESGLARVGVNLNQHARLVFTALGFREDARIPAAANTVTGTDIVDRDLVQTQASLRLSIRDPAQPLIDFSGAIYWNRIEVDEFRRVPARPARTDFTGLTTHGFDIQNTSRFSLFGAERHALTLGVDAFRDEQESLRNGVPRAAFPESDRAVLGVYLQDEITWGRLGLVLGARLDQYDQNAIGQGSRSESEISPKAALSVRITDWLQPYVAYTTAFRPPSLTELFVSGPHFPGNVFIPNPNLRPETARNQEVGVNLRFGDVLAQGDRLRARVSVFQTDVDDFIESVVTRTTTQSRNITEARITGVELEAQYDSGTWFVNLGASALRGQNRTQGGPLANIPQHKASTTIGYRFVETGLTLGARVLATTDLNRTVTGQPETGGYTVFDLFASYEPPSGRLRGVRFDLAADNLFDRTYRRSNWDSIPRPPFGETGRNIRVSARVAF